jgi:hypothetical protein
MAGRPHIETPQHCSDALDPTSPVIVSGSSQPLLSSARDKLRTFEIALMLPWLALVLVVDADGDAELQERPGIDLANTIPEGSVSGLPFGGHLHEHRFVFINVVVDDYFALGGMQAVKPASILRERPAPGNRQSEKQRIKTGIVETFA